jgi:hypothetical protein
MKNGKFGHISTDAARCNPEKYGHLKIFKIIEKITQNICTSMMRRPADGSVTFGYLFSTLPNIPDVLSGNDFPQNPTSTTL